MVNFYTPSPAMPMAIDMQVKTKLIQAMTRKNIKINNKNPSLDRT